MCVALNSATAKLSHSSSSSTVPPLASFNFFSLLLNLSASVYPSTSHPFSISVTYFTSLHFCLSPSLILSHTFTHLFVSFTPSNPSPPLSFPLALCPSPSFLIRAICWRERDLRMDRIVLYVQCGTVLEPAVRVYACKCGTHACICV